MKKKILLSVGTILVVLIAAVAYYILSTRNLSPKGSAAYTKNDLSVSVKYGRPYKKGRLIFGKEDQGALVPYDKYWRLGANEATEITFNKDVVFAGKPVKKGSYRMYAVPSENTWSIVLNSELGQWGAWEADHKLDVVKIEAVPTVLSTPIEQFTIDFAEAEQGMAMNFSWDTLKLMLIIQ